MPFLQQCYMVLNCFEKHLVLLNLTLNTVESMTCLHVIGCYNDAIIL